MRLLWANPFIDLLPQYKWRCITVTLEFRTIHSLLKTPAKRKGNFSTPNLDCNRVWSQIEEHLQNFLWIFVDLKSKHEYLFHHLPYANNFIIITFANKRSSFTGIHIPFHPMRALCWLCNLLFIFFLFETKTHSFKKSTIILSNVCGNVAASWANSRFYFDIFYKHTWLLIVSISHYF